MFQLDVSLQCNSLPTNGLLLLKPLSRVRERCMALRLLSTATLTGVAVHQRWHYYPVRTVATELTTSLVRTVTETVLHSNAILGVGHQLFYLGGVLLVLDWGPSLLSCVRLPGRLVLDCFYLLLVTCTILLGVWARFCDYVSSGGWLVFSPFGRTEHQRLTFALMAAPAADATQSAPLSSCPGLPTTTRCTREDGGDWMWAVVLPADGQVSPLVVVGGNTRRAGHGIPAAQVNWLQRSPCS